MMMDTTDNDGDHEGAIARLGQSLSNLGVNGEDDGRGEDNEVPGPLPGQEDMQG